MTIIGGFNLFVAVDISSNKRQAQDTIKLAKTKTAPVPIDLAELQRRPIPIYPPLGEIAVKGHFSGFGTVQEKHRHGPSGYLILIPSPKSNGPSVVALLPRADRYDAARKLQKIESENGRAILRGLVRREPVGWSELAPKLKETGELPQGNVLFIEPWLQGRNNGLDDYRSSHLFAYWALIISGLFFVTIGPTLLWASLNNKLKNRL